MSGSPPPITLYVEQAVFTTVPLVFAVLHLLFFFFDRLRRDHLYFAVLSTCFSGAAYFEYQQDLTIEPPRIWGLVLIFGMILSMMRLVQERIYDRPPRRFWWFVAAAVAGTAVIVVDESTWLAVITGYLLVSLAALAFMFPRLARSDDLAAWILGLGFLALAFGGALDVLIDLGFLTDVLGTTNPWLYAAMIMLLAISMHLAHDFARINIELEQRLAEVERLSEERVRQERAAREQEIARRLLEAENARKTRDLEEARTLQLAMLPAGLPETDRFELEAFTRTATEVGGDYYDVHAHPDGALTLALGDAVGHGARAGMLVAVSKGLFHLVAEDEEDLGRALGRFNLALRKTRLERASMALLLARLRPGRLHLAGAGIPPPLLARRRPRSERSGRADRDVEELSLAGLPLGSSSLATYREHAVELAPGDTLLFTTDGLAEAPRGGAPDGDPFGYERVRATFARVADEPIDRIPRHLWEELRAWTGDTTDHDRPADDVTMLLVRVR